MYSKSELEQLRDEHEFLKSELKDITRSEDFAKETFAAAGTQLAAILDELNDRRTMCLERKAEIEVIFLGPNSTLSRIAAQPDALPIDGTQMVNLKTGATVFAG